MSALLIDTDIGDDIDDALALAFALRSREAEVLGITTVFGDVALRARLARKLLVAFGRPEIPVAEGIGQPLAGRNRPSGCLQAEAVFADEPLPPLYPGDATRLITETALARPGQVTLVAIGPLTNVATALEREPRLASALAGIVMMGSATFPNAEWNTRSDPEALRVVLASQVPLTVVGMNVTLLTYLSLAALRALDANLSREARLLRTLVALWQRGNPRRRPILHDPLTVAAAICPDLLTFAPATMTNVLDGRWRGWSVTYPTPAGRVRAAIDVRRPEFTRVFVERVIG